MAFDQSTRNRLARFVNDARGLLTAEFTRQLQNDYGLDPERGAVADLTTLTHLDDAQRATAHILRDTLSHYLAGQSVPTAKERQAVLARIVREQAFTVLNRLCALRMAEARGLLLESIGNGFQSKGFQLYDRLAGHALGETGDAYRTYLFSLFDEFAVDLAVLFDRFSPQGRLFPREAVLQQLLSAINHVNIAPLWAEDETIGWIYQYFNSKEERKAMRDASQAPRNSRELAVRNQFFTPRYVVEFLTDNTLGRIWYDMTQGQTDLVNSCRYLVRRPTEIFLAPGEQPPTESAFSTANGQEPPAESASANANGDVPTAESALENADGNTPTAESAFSNAGTTDTANLSQEELLQQPVYIPFRPLKDPRDIKMLDPACGSMHFGLYAFDLFARIYAEAWAMQARGDWPVSIDNEPAHLLTDDYATQADLLRDVPRLILEHNIHGIDIDPRAVQIAGLSLWLRAQRSWQEQGIKAADRPLIRKSNIVCAEPMPGDQQLLEEFLKGLRDERLESLIQRVIDVPEGQRVRATPTMADTLCDLVRTVWEEMKLAGEAGSLLKIEEALSEAIAKGKAEWEEKMPLFRVETFRLMEKKPKVNYVKIVSGDEVDFWNRAEALVLAALREYSTLAKDERGYQRQLFADDASRGFAFIDICRNRYEIILMNPPFGHPTNRSQNWQRKYPKDTPKNLYSLFMCRASEMIGERGTFGVISDSTFLKQPTFLSTRHLLLSASSPVKFLVDLGWNVLDANVRTAASIVMRPSNGRFYTFDVSETEDKGTLLLNASLNSSFSERYHRESLTLPKSIFALNLTREAGRTLTEMSALGEFSDLPWGCGANDSFRLFRLRWEVPCDEIGQIWSFLTNGGPFSPYFRENYYVCRSRMENGDSAFTMRFRNGTDTLYDASAQELYYSLGLNYPKRSEYFHVALLPKGHIFTPEGKGLFLNTSKRIWSWLGLLNSTFVTSIGSIVCGPHKQRGDVELIRVPKLNEATDELLSMKSKEIFNISRNLMLGEETSIWFLFPGAPEKSLSSSDSIENIILSRQESIAIARNTALSLMSEVDEIVTSVVPSQLMEFCENGDLVVQREKLWGHLVYNAESILSYLYGCIVGRWDIRFATGELSMLELPDPFEQLPVNSVGARQDEHNSHIMDNGSSTQSSVKHNWSGIIVDDPNNLEDIETLLHNSFRMIWKKQSDQIEYEVCQRLKVQYLREYFINPNKFFAEHLKRYSKGRRYAPLYWPLSTPSNSYTLWLYYHRLTDQTLYTCINDFVEPKLAQVQEQVAGLQQKTGRSRNEERELEGLSDLAVELQDFRDELLRIAQFWKPNLNDGVQITAAPLWRLFRHRAWQKRLKGTWAKLEAGDYDWAHLAYAIWPERVTEKCKSDKSLAIAHDLEHLYIEPEKPVKKKGKRKKQPDAVQAEIFKDE